MYMYFVLQWARNSQLRKSTQFVYFFVNHITYIYISEPRKHLLTLFSYMYMYFPWQNLRSHWVWYACRKPWFCSGYFWAIPVVVLSCDYIVSCGCCGLIMISIHVHVHNVHTCTIVYDSPSGCDVGCGSPNLAIVLHVILPSAAYDCWNLLLSQPWPDQGPKWQFKPATSTRGAKSILALCPARRQTPSCLNHTFCRLVILYTCIEFSCSVLYTCNCLLLLSQPPLHCIL